MQMRAKILYFLLDLYNKIGLIELPEPIQPSATIQPKELPTKCVNMDEAEQLVRVAGIGQTDPRQSFADIDGLLRYMDVLTVVGTETPPAIIMAIGDSPDYDLGGGDSGWIDKTILV